MKPFFTLLLACTVFSSYACTRASQKSVTQEEARREAAADQLEPKLFTACDFSADRHARDAFKQKTGDDEEDLLSRVKQVTVLERGNSMKYRYRVIVSSEPGEKVFDVTMTERKPTKGTVLCNRDEVTEVP